jgi:uncharacterized membrane protein YhaH (DUF805 family)
MTKHDIHGRHVEVKHHTQHELKPPTVWRRAVPYLIVAVLAGVPFCLGKYFEFNSPEPFDGGAYMYSANHILNGARIGIDEIPSAHPGTLFVNMLSIKLFGYHDISPKIIQGILQAAALIVMFLTLGKLWGKLAAGVSVIVASVYLSAPVIAKYGNVKEQFMIVFMVLGVCCFIWQQLNSRWWYALLAGAFLVWAPMFKPTGISAAAGVGLFVLLQPILKNRSWRQMGVDLGLLLGGAAIAMAPLYIWILGWHVQMSLPYWFLADFVVKHLPGGHPAGGEVATDYVSASHAMMPYSELVPRVMRYYLALILPVAMAMVAIVVRLERWRLSKVKNTSLTTKGYERFVFIFAVWWILDMALIWVSAHSYEQYYLPLTASATMLGGYTVALYVCKLGSSRGKRPSGLFSMEGRWTRAKLFWCTLVIGLCAFIGSLLAYRAMMMGLSEWTTAMLFAIFWISAIVIQAIQMVKRLRDLNRPGLHYGLCLIPLYNVYFLSVLLLKRGTTGRNAYGLDPLDHAPAEETHNELGRKGYVLLGIDALLIMVALSLPVFLGFYKSPFNGTLYPDPTPRNGYLQKWTEIQERRQYNAIGPWEQLSYYVKKYSEPNDPIYVWGWFPGIYVLAERVSPTPIASEGSMHTLSPQELGTRVDQIVEAFKEHPPKFIVDSYKMHFPFNRPQLELWPSVGNGFRLLQYTGGLPTDQSKFEQVFLQTFNVRANDFTKEGFLRADNAVALEHFETAYENKLGQKWPDEAQRFKAMKPFRDYVMQHYKLIRMFADEALYQRK